MVNTFHEILDIAADEKKGYQQLIASLAISLIGRLHYEDTNHTNGDTYIMRVINQAKTVMKEDMDNQPLEEIAESLGISYSLFRREFRRKCGISPGQYRLELRLAKAKELLYSTNMSIAEISSMLHFECIGQFSTFFKKRTGIPPHEFRKQGAKKD
jgi:AraC-like DNA-binding protein